MCNFTPIKKVRHLYRLCFFLTSRRLIEHTAGEEDDRSIDQEPEESES